MTAPIKHEHLADMIQAEMKERDWTITDLIMNMGPHFSEAEWEICQLSWKMFFAVRDPAVILGDVMAEQLATAFEISKQFFLSFHESWRKSKRDEEIADMHRFRGHATKSARPWADYPYERRYCETCGIFYYGELLSKEGE